MKAYRTLTLSICAVSLLASSCAKNDISAIEDRQTVETVSDIIIPDANSIVEDKDNFIWVGSKTYGLFRYDRRNYLHFFVDNPSEHSLPSQVVNDLEIDDDGNLWIATQKGICRYLGGADFEQIPCNDANNYVFRLAKGPDGTIYGMTRLTVQKYNSGTKTFQTCIKHPFMTKDEPSMVFDKNGCLWISYDNTLIGYDKGFSMKASVQFDSNDTEYAYDGDNDILVRDGQLLKVVDIDTGKETECPWMLRPLSSEGITEIKNVNDNVILIRTNNDSYCLDCMTMSLYDHESEHNPYSAVILNPGYSYLFDNGGNAWIANADGLKHYKTENDIDVGRIRLEEAIRNHPVRSSISGGNYIWYATSDGYIITYDNRTRAITGFTSVEKLVGEETPGLFLSYNKDGYIFASCGMRSYGKGYLLGIGEKGVPYLKAVYHSDNGFVGAFDNRGNIWAGGFGCIRKAPVAKDGQKDILFEDIPLPSEHSISYQSSAIGLKDGNVLVLQTDMSPVIVNSSTGEFAEIATEPVLNQVYYMKALQDAEGNIWVGTSDHGLYVKAASDDTFRHVEESNLYEVGSIGEDSNGGVYFVANKKFLYLKKATDTSFSIIWKDHSELPESKSLVMMPDKSLKLLTDGDLISLQNLSSSDMGTLDAPVSFIISNDKTPFATFKSDQMKGNTINVDMSRTGLYTANLKMSVMSSEEQNSIYSYRYRINNMRNDDSTSEPDIQFYNLKQGKNVIKLKVLNENEMLESPEYTIVLRTKIPFYFRVVPILIIVLLALVLYLLSIRKKKQAEVLEQKHQKEMQEQVNVRNMDFFANISHEFRTPLTLISGAASVIENEYSAKNDRENAISVIKRNTGRMLKLVGQILDFNKLDHDMLKLSVKNEDIPSAVKRVTDSFCLGASVKNIDFIVEGCDSPVSGMIDSDKIEKILYNLISNAFKYTSPGGSIIVSMDAGDYLTLKVSDSGIGLQEDKIPTLFDRFTQIAPSKKTGGTGIGLYFCKGLAELHHGTISAANRYEKTESGENRIAGAVFTVRIPITAESYSEEELAKSDDTMVSVDKPDYSTEIVSSDNSAAVDDSKQTILLIDDDYEIVHYLKSMFSSDYNVVYRFDAMSGYNQIEETHPDIIICDIMMVDMDGLELCRMVKENISMSHIPFIMLTAKSALQDQLDSFNSGADAYVTKPFNPDYLKALVKSQLENRRRMENVLSTSVKVPEETKKKLSAMDQKFMDTVYELMEKNIEDGVIDIDQMAESIGVGRSKFYYKLKALTGQTPNEFFTSFKLNKAKEMLEEGKYKISAIANIIGFNSSSHFASLFKKKFGMLPSQYIDSLHR